LESTPIKEAYCLLNNLQECPRTRAHLSMGELRSTCCEDAESLCQAVPEGIANSSAVLNYLPVASSILQEQKQRSMHGCGHGFVSHRGFCALCCCFSIFSQSVREKGEANQDEVCSKNDENDEADSAK